MPPRARAAQRTATRSPQRAAQVAAPASTGADIAEAPAPDASVPSARWVALKSFTINGRRVSAGDPVPEVDALARPEALLRHHFVRFVPEGSARV
jgi:hypothetical protein